MIIVLSILKLYWSKSETLRGQASWNSLFGFIYRVRLYQDGLSYFSISLFSILKDFIFHRAARCYHNQLFSSNRPILYSAEAKKIRAASDSIMVFE